MFNYVYDQGGVYIKNLSNTADQYGIGQYRFPHNYELVGKEFTIREGDKTHRLKFLRKDAAELDGKARDFEALKLEATTYFVRLGFDVAVVDLGQGLITLIQGDEYFYGKIDGLYQESAAHADAHDEMVGTGVAWVLGCGRYTVHEFIEEGKCRVRWSPVDAAQNDHPCRATKIKGPMYLVDIKGFVPFNVCASILTERVIALQDYDHMMTVGCVMGGGMTPVMISGYARFLGEENVVHIPGGAVLRLD
jgi:hypothetical protein